MADREPGWYWIRRLNRGLPVGEPKIARFWGEVDAWPWRAVDGLLLGPDDVEVMSHRILPPGDDGPTDMFHAECPSCGAKVDVIPSRRDAASPKTADRDIIARAIEAALNPMIEPGAVVTLWSLAESARDEVCDALASAGYRILPPGDPSPSALARAEALYLLINQLRGIQDTTPASVYPRIIEAIVEAIGPEPSEADIERAAQAMLDDIGNGDRLNLADKYRRIITVQLSSADLCGMARAAFRAIAAYLGK